MSSHAPSPSSSPSAIVARSLLVAIMAVGFVGCGGEVAVESDGQESYRPPVAYSVDIATSQGTGFTSWVQASGGAYAISYVLVSAPRHGFLEFHTVSGRYTYTPLSGFVGRDTFMFQAYDGVDYSDVGVVTIDVSPVLIIVAG